MNKRLIAIQSIIKQKRENLYKHWYWHYFNDFPFQIYSVKKKKLFTPEAKYLMDRGHVYHLLPLVYIFVCMSFIYSLIQSESPDTIISYGIRFTIIKT